MQTKTIEEMSKTELVQAAWELLNTIEAQLIEWIRVAKGGKK